MIIVNILFLWIYCAVVWFSGLPYHANPKSPTSGYLTFIYLSMVLNQKIFSKVHTFFDNPSLRIMPPTRRKSAASSQKTLAFGPRSKVTKPSAPLTTAVKKASQGPSHAPPVIKAVSETSSRASLGSISEEESEPERPLTPINHGAETGLLLKSPGGILAIRQPRPERTEPEKRALRIGDGELRKYWLRTEDERKAKAGAFLTFYFAKSPSLKPRLMPVMNL